MCLLRFPRLTGGGGQSLAWVHPLANRLEAAICKGERARPDQNRNLNSLPIFLKVEKGKENRSECGMREMVKRWLVGNWEL